MLAQIQLTVFETVGFDDLLCLIDDVGHVNLKPFENVIKT